MQSSIVPGFVITNDRFREAKWFWSDYMIYQVFLFSKTILETLFSVYYTCLEFREKRGYGQCQQLVHFTEY